jgi:single-strand DNA-binding protein
VPLHGHDLLRGLALLRRRHPAGRVEAQQRAERGESDARRAFTIARRRLSVPARPRTLEGHPISQRRKEADHTGEWADKPNYFAITIWGAQGENCARFLAKRRPIAVDGRLEWREWTDKENNKRATVDIIADSIQFLGPRDNTNDGNAASADTNPNGTDAPPPTDVPVDTSELQPAAPGGNAEDDIPF